MLDVEDLLIFGTSVSLLTDLVIFGNFLLTTNDPEKHHFMSRRRFKNLKVPQDLTHETAAGQR